MIKLMPSTGTGLHDVFSWQIDSVRLLSSQDIKRASPETVTSNTFGIVIPRLEGWLIRQSRLQLSCSTNATVSKSIEILRLLNKKKYINKCNISNIKKEYNHGR